MGRQDERIRFMVLEGRSMFLNSEMQHAYSNFVDNVFAIPNLTAKEQFDFLMGPFEEARKVLFPNLVSVIPDSGIQCYIALF